MFVGQLLHMCVLFYNTVIFHTYLLKKLMRHKFMQNLRHS